VLYLSWLHPNHIRPYKVLVKRAAQFNGDNVKGRARNNALAVLGGFKGT
jgi:hypothetical protein